MKGKSAQVNILSLPDSYKNTDIVLESEDTSVADIDGLSVKAIKPGSTRIIVKTNDDKHKSYINILVSTG